MISYMRKVNNPKVNMCWVSTEVRSGYIVVGVKGEGPISSVVTRIGQHTHTHAVDE